MGPVSDFIATEARFGAQNYEPLGVILSRGEGVWVWDTQGNRYLDCLSAYSAVNQGHCHPKILAAMVEQASKLTLTSRAFHNDQLAPFYEQIAELTGSHKVLPMNSGAEAVESAIKSVRKWGYEVKGVPDGQAEIIVCADNFHGRTLGIIGFSAAVLGGLGSFGGAVLGGFLFAGLQTLGAVALPFASAYKDVFAFTVVILLMTWKPTGLIGEQLGERV